MRYSINRLGVSLERRQPSGLLVGGGMGSTYHPVASVYSGACEVFGSRTCKLDATCKRLSSHWRGSTVRCEYPKESSCRVVSSSPVGPGGPGVTGMPAMRLSVAGAGTENAVIWRRYL
jgi:hypothetical protein